LNNLKNINTKELYEKYNLLDETELKNKITSQYGKMCLLQMSHNGDLKAMEQFYEMFTDVYVLLKVLEDKKL
jgi:hypothetical protein